jgi:hypothetical protein
MYKVIKPRTLTRFEPTSFCSVGGDDDHYSTPPGLIYYCKFFNEKFPIYIKTLALDLFHIFIFNAVNIGGSKHLLNLMKHKTGMSTYFSDGKQRTNRSAVVTPKKS